MSVLCSDEDFTDESSIRFLSAEQAAGVLAERDAFVKQLSPFDRQVRLQTERAVDEDEFIRFVASQAVEWQESDQRQVETAMRILGEKLSGFDLPLPAEIQFVSTTGREEAGAAYTRGNAIILPRSRIPKTDAQLERLLTHELFHIISRSSSSFRDRTYAVIGFVPCHPIRLPSELEDLRITNPDCPLINARIRISRKGQTLDLAPILFSSTTYDATKGGSVFDYLTFRLMVIERRGADWLPQDGTRDTTLLEYTDVAEFQKKIGRNTSYVIHPEETMADNFVHLIHGTPGLPDPWIVEAMRRTLTTISNKDDR